MPGGFVILFIGIVLGFGMGVYLSLEWKREKKGGIFE